MAKKKAASSGKKPQVQFTIDLGDMALTAKEVSSLKNKLTMAAMEEIKKKAPPKGPFVKIIFVKAVKNP
jgi:hypothetical protein